MNKNDTEKNLPFRPIVSDVGTVTHKILNYLVTFLSPLTSSQYNIKNTYEFLKRIRYTKIPNVYNIISFDVKNSFIRIPLDKTIKIILRKIYQERMLNPNIPEK